MGAWLWRCQSPRKLAARLHDAARQRASVARCFGVHSFARVCRDGFAHAHSAAKDAKYTEALRHLADEILASYEATAIPIGNGSKNVMTYDNARLPEALIRAGQALQEPRYAKPDWPTLHFYEGVTIENGIHVPIGNDGWYPRGGTRARYSQQPLEAWAMVDAEARGIRPYRRRGHVATAEIALEWYYGKNSRRHCDGERRRMLRRLGRIVRKHQYGRRIDARAAFGSLRHGGSTGSGSARGSLNAAANVAEQATVLPLANRYKCSWKRKFSTTCN